MSTLVSIVVPVYKVEPFLDRCLESIVNQTYKNLEVILVDDGSPDNCPQMCDKWAEKDNRIKVIHKKNDGLSNARNSGIEIANGEYIMFADSDDFMQNDMVEFLLNLSVKYDADVARCGFYFDFEKDGKCIPAKITEKELVLSKDEALTDLMTSGFGGTAWNKLYRISVIKKHLYDKADGCSEDILHNYRVYKDVEKIVFCDIPKYHYFVRDNSITKTDFGYGAFDIIRAKKIMLEDYKDNPKVYPYAVRGYITSAFIVLTGCISHNRCMDRYDELRDSILIHKKTILKSNEYTLIEKLKVIVLSISPKLYNKVMAQRG